MSLRSKTAFCQFRSSKAMLCPDASRQQRVPYSFDAFGQTDNYFTSRALAGIGGVLVSIGSGAVERHWKNHDQSLIKQIVIPRPYSGAEDITPSLTRLGIDDAQ